MLRLLGFLCRGLLLSDSIVDTYQLSGTAQPAGCRVQSPEKTFPLLDTSEQSQSAPVDQIPGRPQRFMPDAFDEVSLLEVIDTRGCRDTVP